MMITAKPIVVLSNRRKDGTYLVYIRVYFRGEVRRIPTSIVCPSSDLTRSGRIKNAEIQAKADTIAERMLGAVDGLPDSELAGRNVDWVVRRMRCADRLHTFSLDFFTFADEVIREKGPGARCQYVTAVNAFAEYLGRREIDVNEITRPLLQGFVSWLRTERSAKVHKTPSAGLSCTGRPRIANGAESRHIAKLRHLYGKAKERYNDENSGEILIPRSPFQGMVVKPPVSRGPKPLSVETMQRVIDAEHPLKTVQIALDVFVLSFALMGANLADLYEARGIGTDWVYHRKKVRNRRADGAEMRVMVPECVRGRLPSLVELHRMAGKAEFATEKVNKGLERWCRDEGIPRFTFGAARHTFATIARNKAKVEKATVDECLCHVGDYRVTDIYLERDWGLLAEANRKVLELFRW